jgi:hypothetical protein
VAYLQGAAWNGSNGSDLEVAGVEHDTLQAILERFESHIDVAAAHNPVRLTPWVLDYGKLTASYQNAIVTYPQRT